MASLNEDDLPGIRLFHHEVIATPQNTILTLTRDSERVINDTTWIGDRILEWNPEDGSVQILWDLFDFYSINGDRGVRSRPRDWGHGNSLWIGPRGNYILALQFLDQVASIAPDLQSLEWKLGGPGSDFTLTRDDTFDGQHSAVETGMNRVLMFDTGRTRTGERMFSRAIEYELDFDAGSAKKVWAFRPTPDHWSRNLSSAVRLDNGNTLILFGSSTVVPQMGYEVRTDGEIVWSLEIRNVTNLYRAGPVSDIAGEFEVPE